MAPSGGLRTINDVAARSSHKFLVLHFPAHVARVSAATFRETTVVSFIPCFYFVFLAVVGALIFGLFNTSKSERVRQNPSPGVETQLPASNGEPRLFMVVPKTKHGSPAKKEASSDAGPAEKEKAKKSKHDKSRAGSNGGY